jgi:ABC-type polysaccharide/polyol phosphate transport system ATPase subunit
MSIIEVNNVTKEYRLGQFKSLRQSVMSSFDLLLGKRVEKQCPFKALDDVNFKVEKGEVVGIIGTNGAGKSTLLKLLACISTPTRGSVKIAGSVSPLIEVGAGLHPELTGRENIYLNAVILGVKRAEIRKRFDEIVQFAELEEFIDTPVKRYSSGMKVRLGFSIAACINADILIVDEVLAVGDLAFQRKCFDRMEDMIKRQGKTVLLVSHNIRQVKRICQRVILMDHGKIVADGLPKNICDLFYERNDEKIKINQQSSNRNTLLHSKSSSDIELLEIYMIDQYGRTTDKIKHNDDVTVVIRYKTKIELKNLLLAIGVHTTDFLYLAINSSMDRFRHTHVDPGTYEAVCQIKQFPLLPGVYSLLLGIRNGELASPLFWAENLLFFQVEGTEAIRNFRGIDGFVPLNAHWETINDSPDNPKPHLEAKKSH